EDFLTHDDAGRIFRRHTEDGLGVVDVADPQVSVAVDSESVRISKQSRTKALEKLARRFKLQNRRIRGAAADTRGRTRRHNVEASVENAHVTLRVDINANEVSPLTTVNDLRKSRPAVDKAIVIRKFRMFRLSTYYFPS